jgi:hypothetical protein
MSYEEELRREALRVYGRYSSEVVERFNLCPWALRARLEGRVAERVILGNNPRDFAVSLAILKELAEQPETEVALVIYPELTLDRLSFEAFVRELRSRDAARHDFGKSPYAMAAFHPEALPDLSDPERLIPFLRRTPDPTIQLVRQEVLERVRGRSPQGTEFVDIRLVSPSVMARPEPITLRERIARTNLEAVLSAGVAQFDAIFQAIRDDRSRAYERLRERHRPRQ